MSGYPATSAYRGEALVALIDPDLTPYTFRSGRIHNRARIHYWYGAAGLQLSEVRQKVCH